MSTREIHALGPAKYSFWSCYLETFDEVTVLARVGVRDVDRLLKEREPMGLRYHFGALPDYQGSVAIPSVPSRTSGEGAASRTHT